MPLIIGGGVFSAALAGRRRTRAGARTRTSTSRLRRKSSGTRRDERIFGQIIEEKQVEAKVAGEKPARLGESAERPGESGPLHPGRRILFQSGIDVEGEPDRKQNPALDRGFVTVNPILLFRRPEPDPDEIGRERLISATISGSSSGEK